MFALNQFQIYQGNLPPLAVPTGLTARARPGGHVELTWNAVQGAIGYQLYRQAPGATSLQPFGGVLTTLTYDDATAVDGAYQYGVASVRHRVC